MYKEPLTHSLHCSEFVELTLKYNFLYLMSDGTTDFLNSTQYTALRSSDGKTKIYRDKAGNLLTTPKVPIAVVLSQSKGMAIALNDANNGATINWSTNNTYRYNQVNTHMQGTFNNALNMENGYEETWDGNYSTAIVTGEKIKGKNSDFIAFKVAADYTPGVPVSGTLVGKKWYLASYGEWKYIFTGLGFGDISQVTSINDYNWYGDLANLAFRQVNGSIFGNGADYWTSSERNSSDAYSIEVARAKFTFFYKSKAYGYFKVRPFIKY